MKSLLIIKAGSTFPVIRQRLGDFEDWVISACGLSTDVFRVIDLQEGESLPLVDCLSGVIITGSHAMVTDQDVWMQKLAVWVIAVVQRQIPLLGICFGHQLLAKAMGGDIDYHPLGREIGTVAVTLTDEGKKDRLLGGLPDTFLAHATHAQSVINLPFNAVRLAENGFEAQHAFRLGYNAWGLQFHPEFTAEIVQGYIIEQSASLLSEGMNIEALQAEVRETEPANALLKKFMSIVAKESDGINSTKGSESLSGHLSFPKEKTL
jgi:GMP synthase (glutamine-hydrolysing)